MKIEPKKMRILAAAVAAVVIAAVLIAFAAPGSEGERDPYPEGGVTITTPVDYNGNSVSQTYYKIPERVVVGCNTALNLLLYLGLGDRIVGVYYMEEEVWGEVAGEYAKLASRIGSGRILESNISQAVLTDWEPDCIIAWVAFADGKLGSPSYWNALGCNVWALHTMTDDQTLDGMARDYDGIGRVFGVKDKTDAYMAGFSDKVRSLQDSLSGGSKTVAVFDGCYISQDRYWFYGKTTFIGYLLDRLGADNAFRDGGSSISPAAVYDAAGSIDIMFFVCYGSVTFDGTMGFWKSNETLSKAPAIAEGRVLPIKLSAAYGADPSMMDVLDYLVETLK
ncbi:MAG: ABC transporter substrate-binding protein [Candidatus Methanoplasma sp.]|jgi:iron complex transport system substrate-binding protein|nr:ABC transporter substrate-binding protein [Candidatus Methanoplasma sp.]